MACNSWANPTHAVPVVGKCRGMATAFSSSGIPADGEARVTASSCALQLYSGSRMGRPSSSNHSQLIPTIRAPPVTELLQQHAAVAVSKLNTAAVAVAAIQCPGLTLEGWQHWKGLVPQGPILWASMQQNECQTMKAVSD